MKPHEAIAHGADGAGNHAFQDADRRTLDLLFLRAPEATICPSEVARALAAEAGAPSPEGWRAAMPAVHAAVDRLLAEGLVQLRWKGEKLATRAGPYRIGRAPKT